MHDDTAFAKIEHWIAARVIGSAKGWFDRDLRCEEELWIIPAPATGEADSQGLSIHSQGVTEALGPFSFDLNASGQSGVHSDVSRARRPISLTLRPSRSP